MWAIIYYQLNISIFKKFDAIRIHANDFCWKSSEQKRFYYYKRNNHYYLSNLNFFHISSKKEQWVILLLFGSKWYCLQIKESILGVVLHIQHLGILTLLRTNSFKSVNVGICFLFNGSKMIIFEVSILYCYFVKVLSF